MSFIANITQSLEDWGDYPLIVERTADGTERQINSETFLNRIEELVLLFSDAGITKDSAVPLFLNNSWDFPAVFLALLRIKAIPILVKLQYRRIELDEIFRNAEPDAVICDADHIEKIESWTENLLLLIYNRGKWSQRGKINPVRRNISPGTTSINYTYRGYGYPLGAMIGEYSYQDAVRRYQDYVRFSPGHRVLALLPMSHIFTLISSVFLPLLNGLTMYILNSLHPRTVLETLQESRIHYLSTIPEVLLLLAKMYPENLELPYLKALVSGGSFLSEADQQFISECFKVEVLNGYGLTEVAPVTANIRDSGKIGSIGEFCKELSSRIDNNTDSQKGEILVKVGNSFLGYLGRPSETEAVMDKGWFRTGDEAWQKDGMVYFAGELKRTRKVNGQIVDLKEVETALMESDMVKSAVVTGETNHIHAEISLNKPVESERDIIRHLRGAMNEIVASYKIPKTFKIV